MARFAGSQVSFDFGGLQSAAGGTGAAAAAGAVDIGNAFAAQRQKAPRYDELSAAVMKNDADIKAAGMNAEATTTAYGMQAIGQAAAAQMTAQATIEAAEKTASAEKSSGMFGALGQVAGAAIPLLAGSDETIKNDIQPIETALETLRNLKPVSFRYKEEYSSEPERLHHGFIAQEFQKVLPDATYYDESIGKLGIDIGDVIGLLVRANQELEERIGMLEAKQALATV